MKLNEAISKRIKAILKDKKISQYKLEQISGLTHNTMLCIVNCRYKSCNLLTLYKIISALNTNFKEFFDDKIFENLSVE